MSEFKSKTPCALCAFFVPPDLNSDDGYGLCTWGGKKMDVPSGDMDDPSLDCERFKLDSIKQATLEANARGEGYKADDGKLDYTLLPDSLDDVVRVLMKGAEKYERDNWVKVPDGKSRYIRAALRHLWARARGEVNDPETGLPHLSHLVCCALFAAWFDRNGK